MKNESVNSEIKSGLNKDILKRMMQVFALLIFTAVILFVSAGHINWRWAWVYIIIYFLYIIINASILPKELLAERGKSKDNVKNWDKTLNKINILPGLGLILVSGLDERFSWSADLNVGLHIAGLIIYISGSVLFSWSMAANSYFSTLVRIQSDRDHKVATGGPYRFVRHPGYTGFILSSLGVPLILGSFWAFIPAGVTAILFIIRTKLEDETLNRELNGYKEFSEKTKYKLIPAIW
jgi:protein-S-isoprenylcysteine O-methyltransferase Ste14